MGLAEKGGSLICSNIPPRGTVSIVELTVDKIGHVNEESLHLNKPFGIRIN